MTFWQTTSDAEGCYTNSQWISSAWHIQNIMAYIAVFK